ncbi:MAG: ComEC/Rec2 family competence protein [Victivallales bacterium]|nr:ComEC/Rec2 family competence protein [Victivallales bacterium]
MKDSSHQEELWREKMDVIAIKDISGRWNNCRGQVLACFGKGQSYHLQKGDVAEINGALFHADRLPGNTDGYLRHLRSLGIKHALSVTDIRKSESTISWKMKQWMGQFRVNLGERLTEGMSQECGNLYQAMMLGRKDLFPTDMRQYFLRSSTLHVFAISGLHIGIVCTIVMRLIIPRLGFGPMACGVAGVCLSIFYVAMTGASPSSVRASIMIFLVALPMVLRRGCNLRHALCLALFLELVFNPDLLYHAGFLFSFLTVTVLVCSTRVMKDLQDIVFEKWQWMPFRAAEMKSRNRISRCFSAVTAMCLAWLVNTPLTLYLNGILPLGALIVAIPAQTLAVGLVWGAIIKLTLALCSSWASIMMGRCLDAMMRLLVSLAMFGGDGSICFHHRQLTGFEVVCCLFPVLFLLWFWHSRPIRMMSVIMIAWTVMRLVLACGDTGNFVIASFGDDGGVPAICLLDGKECRVLSSGGLSSAIGLRNELQQRGIGTLNHLAVVASRDNPRGAVLLSRSFPVCEMTIQPDTRSDKLKNLAEMASSGTHLDYAKQGVEGLWRCVLKSGLLEQGGDTTHYRLTYSDEKTKIRLTCMETGHCVMVVRQGATLSSYVAIPSSEKKVIVFSSNR